MAAKVRTKADVGMIPGAHPTAPGGMSQQALVDELHEKHGWERDDLAEFLDAKGKPILKQWNAMIEAVIQGRLDREQELKQQMIEEGTLIVKKTKPQPVVEPDEIEDEIEDDLDDLDALLAEYEEAYEEKAAEQAENTAKDNRLFIADPETYDFVFDGHSGASPSGAERWMNCTKSLRMTREFLETLTANQKEELANGGAAARQGTTAHAAGEAELNVILGHSTPAERDDILLELAITPPAGEEYDSDMAEHVSLYVDLVAQFIDERGVDNVLIEQRLEAAIWLSGARADDYRIIAGSGDTVVLPTDDEKSIVVVDYKHGEGVDVDVEENPQLRIYGLGALTRLLDEDGMLTQDVERVDYIIVQPRSGGIKEWSESLDSLLDWRDEELSPALTAALFDDEDNPAEFAPSDDNCQWCPARGACHALAEQRMNAATELFDVIQDAEYEDGPGAFPETSIFDNAALGKMLQQVDGLVKIRDSLREEAQRRLHRGEEVPGYKMVGYTPPRKWTDEAAEALAEAWPELYTAKMITPKQALAVVKVLGAEDESRLAEDESPEDAIGEFIEAPDKRPVIAPEGDRRKTWEGVAPESIFAVEGDD